MPEPIDLTQAIEDSISDSLTPPEPEVSVESTPVEASPAHSEPPISTDSPTPESNEVQSPAAKQAAQDPFDKELGIPSQVNGRENRIPYSRVQKITEAARKKAIEPLTAKLSELEPRVKDYETRLQKVAEFEQVMMNDAPRFIQMLASIPAYQPFFRAIQDLRSKSVSTPQAPPVDQDPMPEPDQPQADGSAVYSMDGLRNLLDWQKRQVTTEVTSRYKPIEEQWQAQQRIQAAVPHVQAQIAEARTWALFNENENEITRALQNNPNLSLERAYQQVVFPKFQANRDTIRQQVLDEIKKAPVAATSAPLRNNKPNPEKVNSGPQSIEDIIRAQLNGLPGRG